MTKAQEVGDYDLRGPDLRTAFAGFCRRPTSDAANWALCQASRHLPEHHVGYELWMTDVAGADVYILGLMHWAKRLAWAAACLKPRMGVRRRRMIEGYRRDWGNQAALDGLELGLMGRCASANARADQFGIHRDGYRRLRNFVAGVVVLQSGQFEAELALAVRAERNA